MFTGIVEEAGRVESIRLGRKSTEFVVRPRKLGSKLHVGNSVAVNGACLTVVGARNGSLRFDVLNETLRCTNFRTVEPGDLVNLERPLRPNAGLDGHFVLGHVDGTGRVRRYEKSGKDYVLEVEAPPSVARYIIEKGSIAVDGISLTVAATWPRCHGHVAHGAHGWNWFRVWIIPHTHKVTNLRIRRTGDLVNLEADIIGKYVDKLLAGRSGIPKRQRARKIDTT
ncbi:MAG: riboflavin synthase [Verrucomicrobiia bacterium]